jgi:SAM-dependent methyltransferase
VRNLLVLGSIGLALWLAGALHVWSGVVRTPPVAGIGLVFPLTRIGLWAGLGMTAMGLWMVWSSRVGKVRGRERLLDRIPWTGEERVLDVGCGRGLMLVGAARRLRGGRAVGVDIWQAEDLSGNRPEATLENARCEGVADRVAVRTADMRELPFPDGAFDVAVSSAAIHNLYAADDREKAIREIARVLAPGGTALIDDIRHGREYTAAFERGGCTATRLDSRAAGALLAVVTMGSLRPATLLARKGS